MSLAIVLGVSMFGANIQASAADSKCQHLILEYSHCEFLGYKPAATLFHNKVYQEIYRCTNRSCNYEVGVDEYKYEWEYQSYDSYRDGHWYCPDCGEMEEGPHY